MFGSRTRLGTLALFAALSAGFGLMPAVTRSARVTQAPANAAQPGRRGLFNDMPLRRSTGLFGRKGARVSMAQQKRVKVRKAGVVRNRRNHR